MSARHARGTFTDVKTSLPHTSDGRVYWEILKAFDAFFLRQMLSLDRSHDSRHEAALCTFHVKSNSLHGTFIYAKHKSGRREEERNGESEKVRKRNGHASEEERAIR